MKRIAITLVVFAFAVGCKMNAGEAPASGGSEENAAADGACSDLDENVPRNEAVQACKACCKQVPDSNGHSWSGTKGCTCL